MLLLQQLLFYGFICIALCIGGVFKTADFTSQWLDLWTETNSFATTKVVPHGLLETPLLVDVQVKAGTDGTIFQASGHIIQNNDLRPKTEKISTHGCFNESRYKGQSYGQSGVIYVYDHRFVKVTATLNKQYGRCRNKANSSDINDIIAYKFRVRAWKSSSLPEPAINETRDLTGSERSFVIEHSFDNYPALVVSRLKFIHTPCMAYRNYYADSIGAAVKGLNTSTKTGYVMYDYDKQNIHVWAGEFALAAGDGMGTEVRVNSGSLELYAWNLSTLKSTMTNDYEIYIKSEKVSTAPGMTMDDTTKLTEIFNKSVETFNLFIKKSFSFHDLFNSSMTLSQLLNNSLTVGELIDKEDLLDLITSEEMSTLGDIIRKSKAPRTFLNGTVTWAQIIDKALTLEQLIDNTVSFKAVLNETLTVDIPLNDTILLNAFLDKSIKIITLVNDSFIKESLENFQFLINSMNLEDIIRNEFTIFSRLLKISKSTRILKGYIKDLEKLINDSIQTVQLLNVSIQEGKNESNLLTKLIYETEDVRGIFDEMSQFLKSVLLNDTITNTTSLGELYNETVTIRNMSNALVSNMSQIADSCDEMASLTADNQSRQILDDLNKTVVQSVLLNEVLRTKFDEILDETIIISKMLQNQKDKAPSGRKLVSSQTTFLEMMNLNDTLKDLVNGSIILKDVLNNSTTLQDVGSSLMTFLNDTLTVSDVLNDHGETVTLVELLKSSNELQMVAKQYENTLKDSDNIFFRGLIQSFDNENKDLRTIGSGNIIWYEHIIIPTLCSFGGMVYGYTSDTVRIWYLNKYPECSEICLEEKELSGSKSTTVTAVVEMWDLVPNKDWCRNEPCKHGGTCIALQQSYNCNCTDGWTGNDCTVDINECDGAPCKNSGKCIDRVNGYTCVCQPWWYGKSCQNGSKPFKVLQEYTEYEELNVSQSMEEDSSSKQTLVILGAPHFDITVHSLIKDRYSCSKYALFIERNDSRRLSVTLMWRSFYSNRHWHGASCTIHWGDGNSSDVSISASSITTLVVYTYVKHGIYQITSSCNEKGGGLPTCPEEKASCATSNNLLDDFYNNFDTPKKVFAQDTIELSIYNETDMTCDSPIFNWRVIQVSGSSLISYTDFIQPQSGHLKLEQGTLKPGIYLVVLEVVFSEEIWLNDSIVLEIIIPDLYTFILGGDFLYVRRGENVSINASLSHDPVASLSYIQSLELVVTWTFEYNNTVRKDSDMYNLMKTKISKERVGILYKILNGTINVLEINTSYFPVNSYGVIIFTMLRGSRKSTSFQVIKFVDNVLPVTLSCVYNCKVSHGGFIRHDKLTLEPLVMAMVSSSSLQYEWKIREWDGLKFIHATSSKSSLTLPKSKVKEGSTYLITVTISTSHKYYPSKLSVLRTFDYVPFGGNCSVDKAIVTSALDWVRVNCHSWSVRSERLVRGDTLDKSPLLSYIVYQRTADAKIIKEAITQRSERQITVMLKVGNQNTDYTTSLIIRICDIYSNYKEVNILNIKSKPVFNAVTATQAGADLIHTYSMNTYDKVLKQLTEMNRTSAIVYYISAVCSNIHLIELPELKPVFSHVLNDNGNGAILDLKKSGNKKVGYLELTLEMTFNQSRDPATYALRRLLKNMTDVMCAIAKRVCLEGHDQQNDKQISSLITNAFTNLAANAEFLDPNIMADIVERLKSTAIHALGTDDSDTIQEVADETFTMVMMASKASVLDTLDQYRPTDNINDAMKQIDEMLAVIGQDINIYDSLLSPQERAVLFMKMHRLLLLHIDETKENAKTAANSTISVVKDTQDKLKQCNGCQNREDEKKQLLKKADACSLRDEKSHTETSSFKVDGIVDVHDNRTCDQKYISLSAFEFDENVFMYDNDGMSSLITSKILRLDIKTSRTRTSAGYITLEQKVTKPMSLHVVPHVDEEDASEFMYHRFLYQRSTENVCIIVKPIAENQNFTDYILYIKFKSPPSIIDFDIKTSVVEEKQWHTCIEPHRMKGHTGATFLAISLTGTKKEFNYSLTITTMGCLTWEEEVTKWNTEKCQLMNWHIEEGRIECLCRHVTDMIFGNSFFVAPNAIDFSTVFLKFSPLSQAAVIGTLAGIFVIYLISVVLLARQDKKDKIKWGITPLRDNFVNGAMYYVIKVLTGMRRGAGTSSRVAFILSGEYEHSGRRELFDGIREEFSTGSIMSFIMSTSDDLGDLQSLQIWHDNSGDGSLASWYLDRVDVYDVKRQKTYSFVAGTWLSLDTGLEAHLPSSPTDRPIEFESRFFGHLRHRLSESHMLISIFYRPGMSTFTRVQRASCALVFIMLNMIASALYFDPRTNYVSPAMFELGPFRLTPQQVYISFVCALITTLPTFCLIILFKRIKGKPETTCCDCYTCCLNCTCTHAARNSNKQNKQRQNNELLKSMSILPETQDYKNRIYLPHWFVYFAWLIVLGATVAPAFFVMLFSMEWGKQKSEEWLTALSMSLLESVLLVDPILVLFVSLFLAVILRSRSGGNDSIVPNIVGKYRQKLGQDDNTLASSVTMLKSVVTEFRSYMSAPRKLSLTLQGDKLKKITKKHRQYRNFVDSLKDIQLNLIFILLVSVICYANRDDRSYLHHSQITNTLVEPRGTPKYNMIKTPNDMINWLNYTVIPYLFLERDEHGAVLNWTERQFTKDYIHYRLGPPRLRQLRTKNGTCNIPYIGYMTCYGEYIIWNEEDEDYCIGWKRKPCNITELAYNVSSDAWKFTSALDNWGLPWPGYYTMYGGGGYIASLHVNLNYSIDIINELYRNLWMDRQTRAVIVDFTLYDAATNIFVYNIYVIEFPQTGGAFTSFATYPVRVYPHHGTSGTWTKVCEVLFVIYLVGLLGKICLRIYRQRWVYFAQFWRVYDLVILLVAVAAIVLFAIRIGFSLETIKKFKQDKKLFVNFIHIVFWDQLLVFFLGLLAFLATTRMLEVFSTMKKVRAIVEIFSQCGRDLFWYGLTFVQIFIGFCGLSLLLFGSQLASYRNMYQCMGTLFIAMIGKSKFTEINEIQPNVAKIFFMLYVLVVVYFILTIFLSILGASIDQVVQGNREESGYDLLTFIMQNIKALLFKLRRKRKVKDSQNSPLGTGIILQRRKCIQLRPYRGNLYQIQPELTLKKIDARINRKRIPKKRTRKDKNILTA